MLAAIAVSLLVKPELAIGLVAAKTDFRIGEEIRFVAPAKNIGRTAFFLVLQGDSMQAGRKAPLCQLQYRPVGAADWKAPALPPGCGNTNPARPEDFIEVKPGATVDLLNGMRWSVHDVSAFSTAPGTYEFRLVYDTTRPFEEWLGGPLIESEKQQALTGLRRYYDQVPKGTFVSKSVRIRLNA